MVRVFPDWYMVMLGLLSPSSAWSWARLGLRSLSSSCSEVSGGREDRGDSE